MRIVVIGGGIHGACVAKHAAQAGIDVTLLEKWDFASGTSSRSTKLAHGGLRYLEMFDFKQVFEGIHARDQLIEEYPEIVKPHKFLIPVYKGQFLFECKLGLGLLLYGFFSKRKEFRSRWIKVKDLKLPESVTSKLRGAYEYTDGILDDTRLVLENLTEARAAGAVCKNYCEVLDITLDSEGLSHVNYIDNRSGIKEETICSYVVNCAGPWVPQVSHPDVSSDSHQILLSRGVHLLFNKKWNQALFLPMEGKARYYFVLPHFTGTLVGTTERVTTELDDDPVPREDEIEEVLKRLEKDIPDAGLNRDSLHYAFAGVRTLPVRTQKKNVAVLSRRHMWKQGRGIISLIGGKYTTADITAKEGVALLANKIGKKVKFKTANTDQRKQAYRRWEERLAVKKVPYEDMESLKQHYGLRVSDVLVSDDDFKKVSAHVYQGELRYAVEKDGAKTLEDILRRRLELEYYPDAGLSELSAIVENLTHVYPDIDWEYQAEAYRLRISEIKSLLV